MSLHSQALGRATVRIIRFAADRIPPLAAWVRRIGKEYAGRALDFYREGELERAEAEYREALVWQPNDSDLHAALGQVYYEQGRAEEAEGSFRQALGHDYRNLQALKSLAIVLQERGELLETMYLYLRYLEMEPKDAVVFHNLGAVFHNLGDYSKALEYYARAEQEDPDDPLVYKNRALALLALGRYDEAQTVLVRAREMAPQDAEFDLLLGSTLEDSGETARAWECYQSAVQKDPESADTQLQFLAFAARQGRHQEVVEHAKTAADLFQQAGDKEGATKAYWELGWSYYMLGDWDRSLQASSEALKLNPTLAPVRFNLGLVQLELGRIAEARETYETGVRSAQATDLKSHAIDDLHEALEKNPQLSGGAEILAMLEARYNALSKEVVRTAAAS